MIKLKLVKYPIYAAIIVFVTALTLVRVEFVVASSITFGGVTSTAPAGDTNNITFTAPVISGSNTVLVICAMVNNSSAGFTSATYDGMDIGSPLGTLNVSATTLGCWVVKNPSSAKTISINTSIVRKVAAFALYYTGVDQTTPNRTVTTATGTSNPATVNVTNSQSGDLIAGAFGLNDTTNANGMTSGRIGAGQTFRLQATNSTSEAAISMGEEDGVSGTVVHSWDFVDNANSGWAVIAIPLIPANVTPTPPTISSFSASPTSITQGNSSTLSWSVSGNPAPTLSIDNGVGTVTGSSVNVSPSVTTTYTLTATNSEGSTNAQTTVTVTAPPPPDTTPPSTPTNLSATAISSSQINLSWTASTDNTAVTGYKIFRNGIQVGTSVTNNYSDTGLTASTNYSYTVSAYDAVNNNSTQSSSTSATTQAVSPSSCTGSCFYVRQGATGTGTDWNNAYNALPSTLQRGATYYIADGSYAGRTFNTAVSGSLVITIKKATQTDHGTDTGWNSTYGDGQAAFSGQLEFTTSNWVVDGVTGGGPINNWTNNFGFKVTESGDGNAVILVGQNSTANNVTIKHVDLQGKGSVSSSGGSASNDGLAIYGDSDTTLSYSWMHGVGRCPFFFAGNINTIMEDIYIQSYFGSSAVHSEVMSSGQGNTGDTTFRNNLITDIKSTGGLMWDNSSNNSAHFYVYGNVFYKPVGANWDQANGVIGGWTGGNGEQFRNVFVYNNTFINVDQESLSSFPNIYSGNTAKNNLFYNSQAPDFSRFTPHDYNHFISSGGVQGEANGTTATGNPFTNSTGLDFSVTTNTPAGTNLGAPYNVDPLGHARITWTKGAFEFVSSSGDTTPPSVPTGLSASAISTSAINLTWTASTDSVGATGYRIYRGGVQIGTSVSNSYSDTNLSPSTLYSYTVSAYDAAGNNSSQSSSASATTQSGTPIPGDLNSDHIVNALDYSLLNSKWLQSFSAYDLQVDGLINSLDFAILSSNWGRTW